MTVEPVSWAEEVCSHCKGYPEYEFCECSELVEERRQRREDRQLRTFVTGTRQVIHDVHRRTECAGRPCVIHAPSDHHMQDWPTNFRTGGWLDIKPPHMERMCEHGVGHPDPDDVAFWNSRGVNVSIHGCDGCCTP